MIKVCDPAILSASREDLLALISTHWPSLSLSSREDCLLKIGIAAKNYDKNIALINEGNLDQR